MRAFRLRDQLIAFAAFMGLLVQVSNATETALIDPETLLDRIERGDPELAVLDVRTPEEFAAGHVPGAINIPYTHLPARISEVPDVASKDIVLYCRTGVRSANAAERLKEVGFTRLLQLEGDMQGWQQRELPTE